MRAHSSVLEHLSREHRQALQLCDNIRKGLSKKIDRERIRSYTDWFRSNYLEPHFELEEQHVFPLLGNNVRVKKARANHRRIHKLLSCDCDNDRVLNLLEEELSTYIRFEERVLYKEIANTVGVAELNLLKKQYEKITFSEDEWEDKFWIS